MDATNSQAADIDFLEAHDDDAMRGFLALRNPNLTRTYAHTAFI